MDKSQGSKKSPSTKKKPVSQTTQMKKLKKLVEGSPVKKGTVRKSSMRTKKEIEAGIQRPNENMEKATIYEATLTLTVTKRSQLLNVTAREKVNAKSRWESGPNRTVTTEQVTDKLKRQIFRAGSVTIVVKDKDHASRPVEIVNGLDAIDVELILQLLEVAE